MVIHVALSEFVAHAEEYLRKVSEDGEELRVHNDVPPPRPSGAEESGPPRLSWEGFLDLMAQQPQMSVAETDAFAAAVEAARAALNGQPLPEHSWD